MRELLLFISLAAVGYLAYDDYYKKRPALEQAQQQIQQLQQTPGPIARRVWTAPTPAPPAWFQKHLDEGASLDSSRRHEQPDPSRP